MSNYPNYYILEANQSSISGIPSPIQYKSIVSRIIYKRLNVAQDIEFNLNNITYTNGSVINGKNKFKKSTDYTTVMNSLKTMFKENKVTEEFTLQDFSNTDNYLSQSGTSMIEFRLKSKVKGNAVKFTSTMYTDIDYLEESTTTYNQQTWTSDDVITFTPPNTLNISSDTDVWMRDEYLVVVGDDLSEDVENLEIGLDIYRVDKDANIIADVAQLSKKGFGTVDFNISSIINVDIEKWKPVISDFHFHNEKYIERYMIQPFVRFVDTTEDEDNTYANIILTDDFDATYFIDYTKPLFKDYNEGHDNTLEFFNQGTYGVYNQQIHDYLLTNQPRYKKLNQSYEILSNCVIDTSLSVGQQFNDVAYFKFYYTDNTTETITMTNLNTLPDTADTLRYINQISFNTQTLKNKIAGEFLDVWKIDVNFFNPSYYGSVDVLYETMTYYIDSTVAQCDDIDETITYTPIVFKNEAGGFDLVEFSEIKEINSSRNIETLTTPFNYNTREDSEFEKVWDTRFSKEYTISSSVLTLDEFNWLGEIGRSNQVYILEGTTLFPIIITDFDYRYEKDKDLIINITFRYSRPENVNNN
jgi:hypothetical protein